MRLYKNEQEVWDTYQTEEGRFGIEKIQPKLWCAWRVMFGRKVYYQHNSARGRDNYYFTSRKGAEEFLESRIKEYEESVVVAI